MGGLPRSQAPSGGGGLLFSQGAASQRQAVGLSGGSQLPGGSQRDGLSYGGGTAAGLLGGVMQGSSSSNLADLFTTTGRPYDSGMRATGAVIPAAAAAAAAEARAAAGAAAAWVVQQPAVVPGGTSQPAVPVGGPKVRGGGGGSGGDGGAVSGAPAEVEVVDLLNSDSDEGDDEGAAKAGSGQPPDCPPSSQAAAAAAAARTAGGRSVGSPGGGEGAVNEAFAFLGRMAAEQPLPPQQQPSQPLWSGAVGGPGQVQGCGNAARKNVQRARKVVVSETAVEQLLAMGFEERMARKVGEDSGEPGDVGCGRDESRLTHGAEDT